MRPIAQIPATAAIRNTTALPVIIGSTVSISLGANGTATFVAANYPLKGVWAPNLEVVQELWQGIANLVQAGVLEFTDATTLVADDTVSCTHTAVDAVTGLRPGMPGYWENTAVPKLSGALVALKFTVAFSEPVSKANGAALAAGDFAVAFAANGGDATAAAIASATAVGGGALAAGATAAEINITVTGTASGEETVTLTAPGARDAGDCNGQNKKSVLGSVVGTLAA